MVDGPITESKELVAGWIIQVKSREEALEWAKRAPNPHGEGQEGEIEVRQFFELDAFGPSEAVDRAAEMGRNFLRTSRLGCRFQPWSFVVRIEGRPPFEVGPSLS